MADIARLCKASCRILHCINSWNRSANVNIVLLQGIGITGGEKKPSSTMYRRSDFM